MLSQNCWVSNYSHFGSLDERPVASPLRSILNPRKLLHSNAGPWFDEGLLGQTLTNHSHLN
jgi:hypothetical protein